jgi:hypothetical protein
VGGDCGRAVALGDTDGGEEVGVVLALEGLDQVLVDRAGLAQTGQRVALDRRAPIDHGDVLQGLHWVQADLAAELDREQNVFGMAAGINAERAAMAANSTSSAKMEGASADGALDRRTGVAGAVVCVVTSVSA